MRRRPREELRGRRQTRMAAIAGGHSQYRVIVSRGYPSLADLAATYSSKPSDLVPSAQGSLTAEFGMGSGSRLPAITTRPAKDGCEASCFLIVMAGTSPA